VLAAKQRRDVAGQAAKHDIGGIDDMPLTLDVTGLGAESAHSRKPSRMGPDPWARARGGRPGEGVPAPAAA